MYNVGTTKFVINHRGTKKKKKIERNQLNRICTEFVFRLDALYVTKESHIERKRYYEDNQEGTLIYN